MAQAKVNILIVGAEKGGADFIELLSKNRSVKILGVVDSNLQAPGMKLAAELNIPTARDWKEFMDNKDLDEIIDTTGKEDVFQKLIQASPEKVNVMGGPLAKLIWVLFEERKEVEELLQETRKELEDYVWGMRKTNEAIKLLYRELKEKNERLQELDRLKSDFVSTVSHELRTPLTTIRETVAQVLDGLLGEVNTKQNRFLSICLRNIDRLIRIVNDLLDISKIEEKKLRIRREKVDITELVDSVGIAFETRVKEKGLEIKTSFSSSPIELFIDKDKITQVFTNLVGNALKFTESGQIEISVKDGEEVLECAVADTGVGITEEDLPRVFDKFQQFERGGYVSREKGTGLGLSIAKGIVELHKGDIWVESKEGEGTRFFFTLPKFTEEEVLLEKIDTRLALAQKEHRDILGFVINLDNYAQMQEKLGADGTEKVVQKIEKSLARVIREWEFIDKSGPQEIVLLIEVNKKYAPQMGKRLRRVVKECTLDLQDRLEINFSYGHASSPYDAYTARELIDKARESIVSEKEERLNKDIIVVDDEPQIVTSLKKALNMFGYRNVSEAYDGEEAIQKIREKIPDLIILDMKMPRMNGYEVIGRLKEKVETHDIPILIMSGYSVETDSFKEYTEEKAILVLSKPVDVEQMNKLVGFLL